MYLLNLTLETLAENLALDEALLEASEAGEIPQGVLRLWESPQMGVILGRSSSHEIEVRLTACQGAQIAVLRRSSGGGTIVAGPGCLMYAVVLPLAAYPQLQAIDRCHQFVLERMTDILSPFLPRVAKAGTSDLAFLPSASGSPQKFSGNAMRIKRRNVLYHGTLLYDFDLQQISDLLATPTREPEYRQGRLHSQFVSNVRLSKKTLVQTLTAGWGANEPMASWPQSRTRELAQTKYHSNEKWVIYQP